MYAVALTRLASSIDDEAAALARDLGGLAYEQRLKLKPGVPAIVLTTPDPARAADLHGALRGRGHDALVCRSEDIVPITEMVAMRRFRLDDDALATEGARLRWSDIAVLVRAVHRIAIETRETVAQRRLAPGRALLTGGLLTHKTTQQQVITRNEESEAVLYIFPRTSSAPWCMREQRASYEALGVDATPSSARNFELAIERIRVRARQAAYDDRLAARKAAPEEIALLVHVVASSLAGPGTSPFR